MRTFTTTLIKQIGCISAAIHCCQGVVLRGLKLAADCGLDRRSELLQRLERLAKPVGDLKRGFRHHAMLQLSADCVVIHGGQHFMARNNVSDKLYLARLGPKSQIQWLHVDTTAKPIGRCGHCLFAQGERIFTVGGLDSRGKIVGDWVTEIELD